jgi:hypoxanthine phosphoribosyltransferase
MTSSPNPADILKNSELLYSKEVITKRIHELAEEISTQITDDIPLFLNVMNGSVFFFAELLKHIEKPFLIDYVHATRYNNTLTGTRDVSWLHQPDLATLKDKNIYIIDDILDEGYTLLEIKNFLLNAGAKSCKIAVLIDKMIGVNKPITADYIGFAAPNKYLFGYGMDVFGLYRQLPYLLTYNVTTQ